ncbi:MAG: hypothetical protein Q8P61_02290 [Candidatus Nanopelagicales bacterium]|nr:hypothetical protein [Candidatus Nanopelagicales bacterium]
MKRSEPLFTEDQSPSEIRAAIVAAGPVCFEDLHPSDQGSLGVGKLRLVGVYDDRYEGTFMLRIRIPGGWLTNEQALAIADIARDFAVRPEGVTDPDRFVEITTRQDIQVHWIRFEHLAEIWDRLEAVGIRTYQACGNSMRNVTSCAVNGVDPDAVIDVAPIVAAVDKLTSTDEAVSAFLPRKFKVAITGCRTDCLITRINCLAFTPAQLDGDLGFRVHVGGGLSDYPRLASELDLFVRPDLVPKVVRAMLDLFREEGDFEHSSVNRFRALVHQLGTDRLTREILGRVPEVEAGGVSLSDWTQESHLGIHPDLSGTSYVGLSVPVGRLTADELTEVARLARVHGDGGVRLTQRQDLILTGVADVDRLRAESLIGRLSPAADPFERAVIACTSAPFCKFSILPMKKYGVELIEYLRERVPASGWDRLEGLRIHMSGCKASCAQVPYGHVGLRGAMGKDEQSTFDAMDVAIGGDAAAGELGVWVRNEFPTSDAFGTIGSLLTAVASGELTLDELGPTEFDRHAALTGAAAGREE